MDDYPGPARVCPALVDVNHRFAYMVAGQDLTSCMRFDLMTNRWEQLIPEIKAPGRRWPSCCYLAGNIYMFGGNDGSNNLN